LPALSKKIIRARECESESEKKRFCFRKGRRVGRMGGEGEGGERERGIVGEGGRLGDRPLPAVVAIVVGRHVGYRCVVLVRVDLRTALRLCVRECMSRILPPHSVTCTRKCVKRVSARRPPAVRQISILTNARARRERERTHSDVDTWYKG